MTEPVVVPASLDGLTAAWLMRALDRPASAETTLTTERIGIDFGLASELFRCRLAGGGAPSGSFVMKLWSTDGIAGSNEVRFYESFGATVGARIPAMHHAALDQRTGRGVLVLEDIGGASDGVVQGDCLERLSLERALPLARCLAGVHARWWRHPVLERTPWLPSGARLERPEGYFADRGRRFLERFGDLLDGPGRELFDAVEVAHGLANEALAAARSTLLHADLHLDNVLFTADGQPVLLDWARVASGPAAIDVVELAVEIAHPEDIDAVLSEYRAEMTRLGVEELDEASLTAELGAALLRKFQRTTHGVARWQPQSTRESKIIDTAIARVVRATATWRERDPDLFAFLVH